MRKLRFIAILVLFSFLLVACGSGNGETYLYNEGEHTHVYGNRYDVVSVTCIAAGSDIRYCKICHTAVTGTVEVPGAIEARKHAFSDTVTPPTESTEGYTARQCTLCPYVIERTDVVPPLYALLAGETTKTEAPLGVSGVMMSDTASRVLTYQVGRDMAVPAEIARRLAVALAIIDELAREGTELTADSAILLVSGLGAGNSYTVRELLYEWIASGDADVARGFASALDGGEVEFSARVLARLQKLGVDTAVTVDPFLVATPGAATLGGTATLLARALDEPLLAVAFAEAVPSLVRIDGEKPALYLADTALRISALPAENGTYRFLLVAGEGLPQDIETDLF